VANVAIQADIRWGAACAAVRRVAAPAVVRNERFTAGASAYTRVFGEVGRSAVVNGCAEETTRSPSLGEASCALAGGAGRRARGDATTAQKPTPSLT